MGSDNHTRPHERTDTRTLQVHGTTESPPHGSPGSFGKKQANSAPLTTEATNLVADGRDRPRRLTSLSKSSWSSYLLSSQTAITTPPASSALDHEQCVWTPVNPAPQTAENPPLPEEEGSPAPEVWPDFFGKKQREFTDVILRLEKKRKGSKWKAAKPLTHKPDDRVMTVDESLKCVTDLESFKNAVADVVQRFLEKRGRPPNWAQKQLDRLFRGAVRLREFQNGISSAVQAEPTGAACLAWGITLVVIQFACLYSESAEMLKRVLETLSRTGELLPSLERDVSLYKWSQELRTKLLAIFDDYLSLCVAAIEYSTNFDHPFHSDVLSNKPGKIMKELEDKIRMDVQSFDREVSQVDRKTAMDRGTKMFHVMDAHAEASELRDKEAAASLDTISRTLEQQRTTMTASEPKPELELPVKSLTMPQNEDFMGREKELEALHRHLIASNDSTKKPVSCCLLGVGGMGKTETALEFAYKHMDHWNAGVFWVAADTTQETELLRTFCDIGRALGIVDSHDFDDRNVCKVKRWLENIDRRWLLVFDGFTPGRDGATWRRNMDRIWPLQTNAAGCAILVTAQVEISRKYAKHQISIDPLGDDQGRQLLVEDTKLAGLDESQRALALAISKELGGSPLFLWLARQYIEKNCLTLAEYYAEICSSSNLPFARVSEDWVSSNWRYPKAASATLDLTLRQVERNSYARNMLDTLAFMNPEDISESILLGQGPPMGRSYMEPSEELRQYRESVGILTTAGLVKLNMAKDQQNLRSLRIHHAIQVALLMKLNLDENRRAAAFNRVIHRLRVSYPEPSRLQIASADTSAALTVVLPHVLSALTCFERATPKLNGDMQLVSLLSDVGGVDCYDRGRIREAYRLSCAVKTILDSFDEAPEGSLTLRSDALVVQGLCTDFMALSKRAEGQQVREQCLDIRRRCFNDIPKDRVTQDDMIRLYNCYTDLACSLQQINDFSGIRIILGDCLANYKKWGSEEEIPYEYSKYYNQIAYVHLYENRHDEAVKAAKRGYELAELSSPGTNYPWLYRFDYANILWQHEDHREEAFKLMKSIIAKHSEGLSASYSEILALSMEQNLGIMAYFLDHLELAESQIRGLASRQFQCDAWPDENVVRGNYYLSQVLKKKDPTSEEALKMEQEAISRLKQLLMKDVLKNSEKYEGDYPMLFDYLMHWECRLVTPRQPAAFPIPNGRSTTASESPSSPGRSGTSPRPGRLELNKHKLCGCCTIF